MNSDSETFLQPGDPKLGHSPSSAHGAKVYEGECVTVMRTLSAESVDAVVTDPPYAIRNPAGARARAHDEAALLRAEMLGMQSPNWDMKDTHSRGYADNDPATFTRWCGLWAAECLRVLKPGGHLVAFGGTRTWHRMTTALEDAGFEIRDCMTWLYATGRPKSLDVSRELLNHGADQLVSDSWRGWGTALKPAFEPIVLARKPLESTVAHNVRAHGTGGIDVGTDRDEGRWPTNVLVDPDVADQLDLESAGHASRSMWVAKPGRLERVVVDGVSHPTVKPVELMRRLVRLVTREGGVVLDPFAGSGATVEAAMLERRIAIAVERDPRYLRLIMARIDRQQVQHGRVSNSAIENVEFLF